MEKREQAIKLLEEFKKSRPPMLFEKIDKFDKGINFVIGYLHHKKTEVISQDLSNALNVSTARMAKILNSMEKKGLIIKSHSKTDARKTVVVLTKKGESYLEKCKDTIINIVMEIIDRVGYDTLLELINISYQIKLAMSEIDLSNFSIE